MEGWTETRPAHCKLAVPPAWTGVKYNLDATADRQVVGIDSAGRKHWLYSLEHVARAKGEKFERVRALLSEHEDIRTQIEGDLNEPGRLSRIDREASLVAMLVFETGIRPGSNAEAALVTGIKAYGATTLQVRHVKPSPKGLRLVFVGKKGVGQSVLVTNPYLVRVFLDRKARAVSPRQSLFKCSATSLNKYIGGLGSGIFSAKDFRTAVGTKLALEELGDRKRFPRTKKGIKAILNAALDRVARKLGNTRSVARSAYVDPEILQDYVTRLDRLSRPRPSKTETD
jgi:DNA topoisomerase I